MEINFIFFFLEKKMKIPQFHIKDNKSPGISFDISIPIGNAQTWPG